MRVFVALVALGLLGIGVFFYFNQYRSAFEADQACHAEEWTMHGDNSSFGCDHDLETRQWILYEAGSNHQAAEVLKRFHY